MSQSGVSGAPVSSQIKIFLSLARGRRIAVRLPLTNLMLSVMGAFAEFECSLIRERQREGIALAEQRSAYKGRKGPSRRNGAAELVQRASGVPKALLARDYGISRETVYQYLRHTKLE